jgi:uncharacterized LabA/DUF88 family protein
MAERVVVYVDGFNLYHALKDLRRPYLKWLDLRRLAATFVDKTTQHLEAVRYFSAFATWRSDALPRQKAYVAALKATGVIAVMGQFKEKRWTCVHCKQVNLRHEEKETDVNIAVHMLQDAYANRVDRALLISNDSDLSPVIRTIRADFPRVVVRILTPPGRYTSKELVTAAGDAKRVTKIQELHVERSMLPAEVIFPDGRRVIRPTEYEPPADLGSRPPQT